MNKAVDMMRNLWIIAFLAVLVMAGCVGTEEIIPQDELNVETVLRNYEDLLKIDQADIRNSKAMIAVESFSSLPDKTFRLPFNLNIEYISFYYAHARTMESSNQQEMFNFNNRLGVYQWNSAMQKFEKTTEEANYIQLEFPANYKGDKNNASLRIKEYSVIGLNVLDDPTAGQLYKISAFEVILTIDGNIELTINYHAEYDKNGDFIDVSLKALINPFEFSLTMSQSNGVMQINSKWEKHMEPILSSYFLIARNNINFTPYDGFSFSGRTSGHIKYRELKLDGSFDFSNIEIEKEDKSGAVQMYLYRGNRKLGKLYMDYQTEGERIIPGSIQYFIELEDRSRISADGITKSLFDGFSHL
jgi:hypothetical protein